MSDVWFWFWFCMAIMSPVWVSVLYILITGR
jgi:hypothetical protein